MYRPDGTYTDVEDFWPIMTRDMDRAGDVVRLWCDSGLHFQSVNLDRVVKIVGEEDNEKSTREGLKKMIKKKTKTKRTTKKKKRR